MLSNADLSRHETWQEAAGIGVGAIAGLSPFLTGSTAITTAMYLAAGTGAIFMVICGAHLLSLSRIAQFVKFVCAVGLTAGPVLFGYAGSLVGFVHFVIGAAMLALSALEIWQDWHLSDTELEQYAKVSPRYATIPAE